MRASSLVTFANSEKPQIDPTALFKLSYGLFVVTTKDGDIDNGCICNSVFQVADSPTKIAYSCQKGNYTRELIEKSGIFNISVLTEDVPFEVIKHFGMQSGRDVNKFENCEVDVRSANGIKYIPKYTNAFMSLKVTSTTDLGSHMLFVCDVTESQVLSNEPSCTYAHYHKAIKKKF